MMVLLDMIFGLFTGNRQSSFSPEALVDQFFNSLKKILQSLIILIICSVLLCVLLGYLIDRCLTLLDAQNFHLSNSIIFLLVFIVLDLGMIFWSLRKVIDKPAEAPKKEAAPSGGHVEAAIAALIFDFVKEREARREEEHKKNTSTV